MHTALLTFAVLFNSATGTGPYDEWKYGYYESETLIKTEKSMRVRKIKPAIWSCIGECTYEVRVKDKAGRILTRTVEHEARPQSFDGTLDYSVRLIANKTYRLYTKLTSSKGEVGISTAGSKPFPNRRGPVDMELVYARKGSKRYTERGPIAFTLEGEFIRSKTTTKSRAERVRERREKRLKRASTRVSTR
jgi:hypothetical protein